MTSLLPDVALNERPLTLASIEWVGMQRIDVPITLDGSGVFNLVHASADVHVDLPEPSIKGIHMSRLYRLLDQFAEHSVLTPNGLASLLKGMVQSHADCHSTRARVCLDFNLLCRRAALITEGLSGWKSYPVHVEGVWQEGRMHLSVQVSVTYSSTCPCSAALSRQIVEGAFLETFSHKSSVSPADVAEWLRSHASTATPHSQRSVAKIQVDILNHTEELGLMKIIDLAEATLGTPVQTAVKRADEQEFARLNGQNLMYVEDASRKLQHALFPLYPNSSVFVSHLESLHPHDAVAWTSSNLAGAQP